MHETLYESRSLVQIGTALGRVARYGGAGTLFASVFVHSLVVALLVPAPLRIHALCHDVAEIFVGEHPLGSKYFANKVMEQDILEDFYKDHGLTLPTEDEHKIIKVADMRSAVAEIHLGAGVNLKEKYEPDPEAEDITRRLNFDFPPEQLVTTDAAGHRFEILFERYRHDL